MNGSRLKTLIIIILLLVNTAFLGLYLMDRYRSDNMESDARKKLVRVLAEHGIKIEEGTIPKACPKARFALTRDTKREKELAEMMLGTVHTAEKGGGIYLYESAQGTAWFTGNDEFEIIINHCPLGEKSAIDLSEELLDIMEITVSLSYRDSLTAEDTHTVSYICLYADKQIFNSLLTFTFTPDGKAEITGKGIPETVTQLSNADVMTPTTALISFVGELRLNNLECSQITEIKPGFQMVKSATASSLEPVWLILTDNASCYLDIRSGRLAVI